MALLVCTPKGAESAQKSAVMRDSQRWSCLSSSCRTGRGYVTGSHSRSLDTACLFLRIHVLKVVRAPAKILWVSLILQLSAICEACSLSLHLGISEMLDILSCLFDNPSSDMFVSHSERDCFV